VGGNINGVIAAIGPFHTQSHDRAGIPCRHLGVFRIPIDSFCSSEGAMIDNTNKTAAGSSENEGPVRQQNRNSNRIVRRIAFHVRALSAYPAIIVEEPLDPIYPEETWQRVERDLENTFKGKLSLAYRLGQKAEPSILSDRKKPSRPPKVIIDNKSSDFFTLVEVFANDRVGLLYDITRTLFELRLDIRIAIIATKVDQIADVFYIRDLEGQKVEDEDQLKEIKEALDYKLGLT